MILSLIFFPSSMNVFASSENFLSCASCWFVSAGLPLLPVSTSCKSANPSKPGVERSPVRSHQVCKVESHQVESHQVCQISSICPVASSIFSNQVVSVIATSPQNKDVTFAFIFWYSSGYMVASTYAATHPRARRIRNVFILFLCFGGSGLSAVTVGIVFAIWIVGVIIGFAIGGSTVWNVDPGTDCGIISADTCGTISTTGCWCIGLMTAGAITSFTTGVLGVHSNESKSILTGAGASSTTGFTSSTTGAFTVSPVLFVFAVLVNSSMIFWSSLREVVGRFVSITAGVFSTLTTISCFVVASGAFTVSTFSSWAVPLSSILASTILSSFASRSSFAGAASTTVEAGLPSVATGAGSCIIVIALVDTALTSGFWTFVSGFWTSEKSILRSVVVAGASGILISSKLRFRFVSVPVVCAFGWDARSCVCTVSAIFVGWSVKTIKRLNV